MDAQQNALFNDHTDLAEQAARSIEGRYGLLNGMTLEDYRQHALMGLMQCARKWQASFGKPFEHMARRRCRQAVVDGIRQCDEVGRFRRGTGVKGPSLSLDWPIANSDSDRVTLLGELLASPARDDQAAAYDGLRVILAPLLPLSRAVVYMLEVQHLTQAQVADILGYDQTRISQIRSQAMEVLRNQRSFLAKGAGLKKRRRRIDPRGAEAKRLAPDGKPRGMESLLFGDEP